MSDSQIVECARRYKVSNFDKQNVLAAQYVLILVYNNQQRSYMPNRRGFSVCFCISTRMSLLNLRNIPVGGYEVNLENDTLSFALIKFVASKNFIIIFVAAFLLRMRCDVMSIARQAFPFSFWRSISPLVFILLHRHASSILLYSLLKN